MIIAVNFPISAIGKKKPEKNQASTGFGPVTSASPVRCSTNWAMKPHIGSEVNLLSSYQALIFVVIHVTLNFYSCFGCQSRILRCAGCLLRPRPHVSGYFFSFPIRLPSTRIRWILPTNPQLFESALQNWNFWIRYESGIVRMLNPDIFLSGDVTRASPVFYREYCIQDGNLVPRFSLLPVQGRIGKHPKAGYGWMMSSKMSPYFVWLFSQSTFFVAFDGLFFIVQTGRANITDLLRFYPVSQSSWSELFTTASLFFLNDFYVLCGNQYVFRKNHSPSLALGDFCDKISTAFDTKENAIGLFLDISKAFNTVNHDILFNKLDNYGFGL